MLCGGLPDDDDFFHSSLESVSLLCNYLSTLPVNYVVWLYSMVCDGWLPSVPFWLLLLSLVQVLLLVIFFASSLCSITPTACFLLVFLLAVFTIYRVDSLSRLVFVLGVHYNIDECQMGYLCYTYSSLLEHSTDFLSLAWGMGGVHQLPLQEPHFHSGTLSKMATDV